MSAAVLVCTCDRPRSLRALLDRLETIHLGEHPYPFRCVIVDDSMSGSAKEVVDEWIAGGRSLAVQYVYLGSRNISLARNEVARHAVDDEWWFVLDDDCTPSLEWMSHLAETQRATDADIVCSAVRYVPSSGAPDWLTEQGFLDVKHYDEQAEPNTEAEFGSLSNALIRSAWWRAHPEVRCREEFGRTGGEDVVFMIDARRAGASIRWTSRATLEEELPAHRATLRYQLRRRMWTSNVRTIVFIRLGIRSRARMAARMAFGIVRLARDVAVGAARRQPWQFRRRIGHVAVIVGGALGVMGIQLHHR